MSVTTIRKFFSKPYNWLLLCSLMLIAWPLGGRDIAIQVAGTYFVMAASYFFIPIALLIIVLWLMYRLTDRLMFSKQLSYASILLVCCFFGLLFCVWLADHTAVFIAILNLLMGLMGREKILF